MDLGSLFQVVMFQLVTARDAPYPIALAALVTALVVWVLTRWWYRSKIGNLKRAVARRDGELARLRAHGQQGSEAVAGEATDDDPTRAAPRSAERRVLRLTVNAIEQADLALRSDDAREIDRALSGIAMALQAAQTTFDLPVPVLDGAATPNLRAGSAYLERIRPALRTGDAEEARRLAAVALADASAAGGAGRPARVSA